MSFKYELLIGFFLTVLFLGAVVFLMPAKSQTTMTEPTTSSTPTTNQTPVISSYSPAEVAKHGSTSTCWLIISGNVYDVTEFLSSHPGGSGAIIPHCGTDATTTFNGMIKHGSLAQNELASLLIGTSR